MKRKISILLIAMLCLSLMCATLAACNETGQEGSDPTVETPVDPGTETPGTGDEPSVDDPENPGGDDPTVETPVDPGTETPGTGDEPSVDDPENPGGDEPADQLFTVHDVWQQAAAYTLSERTDEEDSAVTIIQDFANDPHLRGDVLAIDDPNVMGIGFSYPRTISRHNSDGTSDERPEGLVILAAMSSAAAATELTNQAIDTIYTLCTSYLGFNGFEWNDTDEYVSVLSGNLVLIAESSDIIERFIAAEIPADTAKTVRDYISEPAPEFQYGDSNTIYLSLFGPYSTECVIQVEPTFANTSTNCYVESYLIDCQYQVDFDGILKNSLAFLNENPVSDNSYVLTSGNYIRRLIETVPGFAYIQDTSPVGPPQPIYSSGVSSNTTRYEITGFFFDENAPTELVIPSEIDGGSVVNISGLLNAPYRYSYSYLALATAGGEIMQPTLDYFTSITLPETLTSISSSFRGCTAEIIWDGTPRITTIGRYAFSGYAGESLTIPASVTSIGTYAFADCSTLTSLTIPEGVRSIGERAFSGCTGLNSITIPNNVSNIGRNAFEDCSAEIVWADGASVATIQNNAFNGYTGTSLTIPSSVGQIALDAFLDCSALTELTFARADYWQLAYSSYTSTEPSSPETIIDTVDLSDPSANADIIRELLTDIETEQTYDVQLCYLIPLNGAGANIEENWSLEYFGSALGTYALMTESTYAARSAQGELNAAIDYPQLVENMLRSQFDEEYADTPYPEVTAYSIFYLPEEQVNIYAFMLSSYSVTNSLTIEQIDMLASIAEDDGYQMTAFRSHGNALFVATSPTYSIATDALAEIVYYLDNWLDILSILRLNGYDRYFISVMLQGFTFVAPDEEYYTEYHLLCGDSSPFGSGNKRATFVAVQLPIAEYERATVVAGVHDASASDTAAVESLLDEYLPNHTSDSFVRTEGDTLMVYRVGTGSASTINTFTLSYSASVGGRIIGATQQTVQYGANGTEVIAVPDEGYEFVRWSDGVTTATRTDVNVTSDITVTAEFRLIGNTSDFAEGIGTADRPYEIETVEHLQNMELYPNAHFTLTADIVLPEVGEGESNFIPLFSDETMFGGTLDGQGHKIVNLTVYNTETFYSGLFSCISASGSVTNLTLENASVSGTNYSGGIAGYALGAVTDCTVTGSITYLGNNGYKVFAGGIAGRSEASLNGCVTDVTITIEDAHAETNVGGIVGYLSYGGSEEPMTLRHSGSITVTVDTSVDSNSARVGGLIGYANTSVYLSSSSHHDDITVSARDTYLGGLIGAGNTNLTTCSTNGSLTAKAAYTSYAGGLVGYGDSTVTDSYATGDVTSTGNSNSHAGGLVGYGYTVTITDSYATGNVTSTGSNGSFYAGGLVGHGSSTVTDSYATGDVTSTGSNGSFYAGGLVGGGDSTITNSYATGNVTSTSTSYASYAGGLVGGGRSTVTDSYATGDVTSTGSNGSFYAGGLVGYGDSITVRNSYSMSCVSAEGESGNVYIGGIAGYVVGSLTLENAHWYGGDGTAAEYAVGYSNSLGIPTSIGSTRHNSVEEFYTLADVLNAGREEPVWEHTGVNTLPTLIAKSN